MKSMISSPRFLFVDLDFILGLSEDVGVSVFLDSAIHDLKGGYYLVKGRLFYPDGGFDYYRIRCYSRREARRVYRLINHYRGGVLL